MRHGLAIAMLLVLGACGGGPEVRTFSPDAYPDRLSAWGILRVRGGELELARDVVPYDVNTPLFTDHAQKLRTVWLPPGTSARYAADTAFDFPVGTIVSKTFFYPTAGAPDVVRASYDWTARGSLPLDGVRLVETRLLVRQPHGWDALPYVWDGDDARLTIAGALERLTLEEHDGSRIPLPYIVPTRNECAACHATNHTTRALEPIGLKARHLNRAYLAAGANQLHLWSEAGRLAGLPSLEAVPRNADAHDPAEPLEARARAYLDANCGHCHNERGAADTSGLLLDASTRSLRALGVCKPPIAAGQGTGGRAYSIVPGAPDASILVFRMETDDPGSRMPELGRSLVHAEGVELISAWIAGIEGDCVTSTGD